MNFVHTAQALLVFALLALFAVQAAAATGGTIGFAGAVFEPARSARIGSDLQLVHDPVRHSATRNESIAEADASIPAELPDYFAGYAHRSSRVITAVHH